MNLIADLDAAIGERETGPPDVVVFDPTPPGERYFRHPGDVVRTLLWGAAALLLFAVISVGTDTAEAITSDLARSAAKIPTSMRELLLVLTQVAALLAPIGLVAVLGYQRRWRRLLMTSGAAVAGALLWRGIDVLLDVPGRLPNALTDTTWIASARFPSLVYVTGAAAATAVVKAWLPRSWRRAADLGLAALAIVLAIVGSAGVPELLLAVSAGIALGAGMLVLFGAPNRRPAPAAVAAALASGGLDVTALTLERAEGGRSQLYVADLHEGRRVFVKVFGRDSRDADLLYRAYRMALLRGPNDNWPSPSLKLDVEREAFLLLLARQGGVPAPEVAFLGALDDGSVALALEYVDGAPLDQQPPGAIDDDLLDATWRIVAALHARHMAHRALRAANVLVDAGRPVLIDLGFGDESAGARLQAIDRAELLVSLATLVGVDRAVASAVRVLGAEPVAAALPYLQPLALTASTRRQASKALLHELRDAVTTATGTEPVPLERLIRVRPRTLLTIAAFVGAFYVLLPQLANVDDSFRALENANWAWLLVAIAMSGVTYVAGAIGIAGGVPVPLPFVANLQAQVASSFANRVTPANVGGMALNVRFLQKAGVAPAEAVTGVGLNSIAGAIVHFVLLIVFLTWAGQNTGSAFSLPGGSKTLAVIALLLAVAGVLAATRRGRHLFRTRIVAFVKRSVASMVLLARSPAKLAALFGGSLLLTLAYIAALGSAVAAFHGNLSIAQVGAVYLGASVIAAAAPTPGGLGALEAALVAGLTGVGMASGPAVAAVLSYRLVTYWLPVVPGWISFHLLERRGLI
jgi:undecaprenyl-diphosphatase